MIRQRAFERVHRVALKVAGWFTPPDPPAPVMVGFDSFHPDCERHAYCGAIDRVLAGQHVILIPAVDEDGARCIHTFAADLNDESASFAHSEHRHVRAAHATVSMYTFRRDLEERGAIT